VIGWLTGKRDDGEVLRTRCAVCGATAAEAHLSNEPGGWRMIYTGIGAGTGPSGMLLSEARADALRRAFKAPYTSQKFAEADLYDCAGVCRACRKPYCYTHWGRPFDGGGHCPKGHFQSLDPHWSPDWSDDA
jgi:hypothetical protein